MEAGGSSNPAFLAGTGEIAKTRLAGQASPSPHIQGQGAAQKLFHLALGPALKEFSKKYTPTSLKLLPCKKTVEAALWN